MTDAATHCNRRRLRHRNAKIREAIRICEEALDAGADKRSIDMVLERLSTLIERRSVANRAETCDIKAEPASACNTRATPDHQRFTGA